MTTLMLVSDIAALPVSDLVTARQRASIPRIDALVVLGATADGRPASMQRALAHTRLLVNAFGLAPTALLALPSPRDLPLGYTLFSDAYHEPLTGTGFDYTEHRVLRLPDLELVTLNTITCLDHIGFSDACLAAALMACDGRHVPSVPRALVHYHGMPAWSPDLARAVARPLLQAFLGRHVRFSLFGDTETSARETLHGVGTAPGRASVLHIDPAHTCMRLWRGVTDGGRFRGPETYRLSRPPTTSPPPILPPYPRHGRPLALEGPR